MATPMAAASLLAGMFLVSGIAAAQTDQAHQRHEPSTLRAIMGELGAEFIGLTDAVLRGDNAMAAEAAAAIAGHPLPEPVVAAIKSALGLEFSTFEELDMASHVAAEALHDAAVRGDPDAVARGTGHLLSTCAACHTQFRARLRPLSD